MPLARLARALLALGLTLVPALPPSALADDYRAGPGAAGSATLVGFVESPTGGQAFSPGSGLVVTGWVVDRSAEGWTGVTGVEVYDGQVDAGGRLLASGSASLPRPDVADFFGNGYWTPSGFSLAVPGGMLGYGPHTLSVYAVTADRGRWLLSVPVFGQSQVPGPTDAFPSDPSIRVFEPLPGSVVRTSPARIFGIALDRNPAASATQTGVDRAEVYFGGPRESGGTLVAVAELGKHYGEAGLEFRDARFDRAGWDTVWNPASFGPGNHDLYVYARRSGTDVWNVSRIPITIAP